jgi:thioredoxin reductase (NADPH)
VSYRRLPVPGLDELIGAGVFYGAAVTEARAMRGRRVFVIGGANSAGQAAVHLARFAENVTLVVRGESLATGMSAYLVREVEAAANIDVRLRTEVSAVAGVGRLDAVTLRCDGDASTEALPADAMFILIGAEPRTEWLAGTVLLDDRGFVLTGRDVPPDGSEWPLERPPTLLETSLPGVFAAGDVRHGSTKRVASAVGEGAIAVALVHRYLAEP